MADQTPPDELAFRMLARRLGMDPKEPLRVLLDRVTGMRATLDIYRQREGASARVIADLDADRAGLRQGVRTLRDKIGVFCAGNETEYPPLVAAWRELNALLPVDQQMSASALAGASDSAPAKDEPARPVCWICNQPMATCPSGHECKKCGVGVALLAGSSTWPAPRHLTSACTYGHHHNCTRWLNVSGVDMDCACDCHSTSSPAPTANDATGSGPVADTAACDATITVGEGDHAERVEVRKGESQASIQKQVDDVRGKVAARFGYPKQHLTLPVDFIPPADHRARGLDTSKAGPVPAEEEFEIGQLLRDPLRNRTGRIVGIDYEAKLIEFELTGEGGPAHSWPFTIVRSWERLPDPKAKP